VFEYRQLRQMFGPKRGEVRGGLLNSDTEELHEFVKIPLSILKQCLIFKILMNFELYKFRLTHNAPM